MHFLYSLALGAALVLTMPYWIVRALTAGKYRAGMGERLGRVPARLGQAEGAVWVHAVSVGEVLAVSRLVEGLRQAFPGRRVLVSTTTATGQKLAREKFGETNVFYFPLDLAFAIRPYLRGLRPALVVMAETEFWPNFLRLAQGGGARVAAVNARISDRSYPRYRALRFLWRRILGNADLFLAQSEEDVRRLVEIGAAPERVSVGGNLKFDVQAPAALPLVEELRQALLRARVEGVLVCGSTVEGEEAILLDAFRTLLRRRPRALMILAARHPERFEAVGRLVEAAGVAFWRRSQLKSDQEPAGGVLLLDTIGELASLYALADVAFVGGSLAPRGGHNILEPAQFAKPILVGPHTDNFRDIVGIFRQSEAVRVVTTASLAGELAALFDDAAAREALGRRARQVFESQAGATARTLAGLERLLAPEMAVRR